ncbi:GAF and ANTAR domain-containing protein [Kribbella sp. NPDC003557]|uniref:GAF and ANTAR domain-containing protein n=1 Tax=Kribbella sp. NPDC003557 TaxID=3154449 RepID=UPI0033B742F1
MDRAAVLGRLARLVAAGDRRQQFAIRLCDAGRRLVGGQGSSISINSGDTEARMTLAATDQVAAQLESLQDILGEGPCREAYRQDEAIVTDLDDAVSTLWPEFTRSALETAGGVTLHCFPMRAASRPFGVYAVYAYDDLSEPDDVVQFLADVVGIAVLQDASAPRPDDIWSARSVVYQATGMVSVQLQVTPADALAMLRAHAFAHDATLDEIAEHVVARRIDFRTR